MIRYLWYKYIMRLYMPEPKKGMKFLLNGYEVQILVTLSHKNSIVYVYPDTYGMTHCSYTADWISICKHAKFPSND